MAFDRYLVSADISQNMSNSHTNGDAYYEQFTGFVDDGSGAIMNNGSNRLSLQMPSYMLPGYSTLAPGGGAEVLSYDHQSLNGLKNSGHPEYGNRVYNSHKVPTFADVRDPIPTSFRAFDFRDVHANRVPVSSGAAPASGSGSDTGHSPSSFPRPNSNASSNRDSQPPQLPNLSNAPPEIPPFLPPAAGLPIYSASGFDMISILSRVNSRPNPRIHLGPVDLNTAFVVCNARKHDNPIVYASPNFYTLTGYSEAEAVNRNCRFLQAPGGQVEKGEYRRFTTPEAVSHLAKSLAAGEECQASFVNYRKNGQPFINLITIVPVMEDRAPDEIAFYVGFQVDLTEQPHAIMQRLKAGTYASDQASAAMSYSMRNFSAGLALSSRPRRTERMSREMRDILTSTSFLTALHHASAVTNNPRPATHPQLAENVDLDPADPSQTLASLLLGSSPDFIHVLSLKGAFQYVAPSITRSLGYLPEDLLGKTVAEYCHPADLVPLTRELKEASATPLSSRGPGGAFEYNPIKSVDLLFRAKRKDGRFVWVECRGRLYVEPGKGRKAIVVSGRARRHPRLMWGAVARAGGLASPRVVVKQQAETRLEREGVWKEQEGEGTNVTDPDPANENDEAEPMELDGEKLVEVYEEREFWVTLVRDGTMLVASPGVQDVLGYRVQEVVGRCFAEFLDETDMDGSRRLGEALEQASHPRADNQSQKVFCSMKCRNGLPVDVEVVVFNATPDPPTTLAKPADDNVYAPLPEAPLVVQVKLVSSVHSMQTSSRSPSMLSATSPTMGTYGGTRIMRPHDEDVFQELDAGQNSSWQYELQQLRFANRRLRDEVGTLEEAIRRARDDGIPSQPRAVNPDVPILNAPLPPPHLSPLYVGYRQEGPRSAPPASQRFLLPCPPGSNGMHPRQMHNYGGMPSPDHPYAFPASQHQNYQHDMRDSGGSQSRKRAWIA